tara:strand:+ start:1819 stop:1947 length:129 start_codon:yes stop_codon:yes gene_type:complete
MALWEMGGMTRIMEKFGCGLNPPPFFKGKRFTNIGVKPTLVP